MPRRHVSHLTVLSAFTGAGGLDLGLERAGFHSVACIERDPHARRTIAHNRPGWNLLGEGDILQVAQSLEPRSLGLHRRQLSVLAGGPPCQPFSTAAQWADSGMGGLADARSQGLCAFMLLAERFLPRVILIENVPGFVQGRSSALPFIVDRLQRINDQYGTRYRLEYQFLQSADFGVPQRRRRAILIAVREGTRIAWPEPTHAEAPVRAYDALHDVRVGNPPVATGQWADLLASIPAGMNYQYHTARGGGLPLFGHRSWFWSFLLKLAPEQPSWTIQAHPGPATGPFHWENRPLATEEMARLQTFPADWVFTGSAKVRQRQIGNATPPLLAEVIGRSLRQHVFRQPLADTLSLAITRLAEVPAAPPPLPVPERFHTRVGTQSDHPGAGLGPGALRRRARLVTRLHKGLERLARQAGGGGNISEPAAPPRAVTDSHGPPPQLEVRALARHGGYPTPIPGSPANRAA